VAATAMDGRPSKAPATAIRPEKSALEDDVRCVMFAAGRIRECASRR
jgi:hypothetical protein